MIMSIISLRKTDDYAVNFIPHLVKAEKKDKKEIVISAPWPWRWVGILPWSVASVPLRRRAERDWGIGRDALPFVDCDVPFGEREF